MVCCTLKDGVAIFHRHVYTIRVRPWWRLRRSTATYITLGATTPFRSALASS